MTPIRALGLSDFHPQIDGVYSGKLRVDPSSGLSQTFVDCQNSLDAVLAWEAENPCDIALLPGDLFDRERPTSEEIMLIERFLLTLLTRMSVVIIPGNHDMDQKGVKASAVEPLGLLGNAYYSVSKPHDIHVLTQPQPVVVHTAKGPVCVSGLPYPSKGRFKSACVEVGSSPEAIMQHMNQALYEVVMGMIHNLHPTFPNIMLAHGTVSTAEVGDQPRVITHDLMIPIDLMEAYELVLLGHIHKHQWVAPNALYCGSLLCQTIGEKNEVKGWVVAEIEKGLRPVVTHIPNPHSRNFYDLALDDLPGQWTEGGVYRVVGEVAAEEYAHACLEVAKFERDHPFTQNDLKIVRADDRARDSTVTALMSEEEAITRVLEMLVPEEDVPAVMALHHTLTEGVRR